MNKFTKGVLIAAGCFFVGGVLLGAIGAAGRVYTGEPTGIEDDFGIVRDTWNKMRRWDLRWRRGGAVRGLTLEYDGIEFDKDYDNNIVYGSFTDDSLRGAEIYNLDVEIGGGTLIICEGDGLELKKEGGPECQYYIENGTFYLKQKTSIGGGKTDLTLTLPEGIMFNEVDIQMGAGEVVTMDTITAKEVEIEIDAGEITIEEVNTDSFSAKVAAGSVDVQRLAAKECDVEVSTGSIALMDSLVTGNLDAEVSMGEIDVFLRDSYENHDYNIDCGMGNITISPENGGGYEYAGLGNAIKLYGKNSGGNSVYDLDCSMGSIYVKFGGESGSAAAAADVLTEGDRQRREEIPEASETLETQEMPEIPETSDIYGIEDRWPERIGRENINTTAVDFSFGIEIAEPTVLVISCVTESGELDLEIEDDRGKDVFEKDEIRTGEYEVKIKSPGTYRVHFDCEDHTGSFWISPKK